MIVGRSALVEKLRNHPLTRALRVDKATLAALQATLLHYARGEAEREIPVWQMIAAPHEELAARAGDLAARLRGAGLPRGFSRWRAWWAADRCPARRCPALPWPYLSPAGPPDELARQLRVGRPPVVGRIAEDELLLDVRTVQPDEDELLHEALLEAWAAVRAVKAKELATDD